jgi:hypothetical protein
MSFRGPFDSFAVPTSVQVSYTKPPTQVVPSITDSRDLERLAEDMVRMHKVLEMEQRTPSYLPELKGNGPNILNPLCPPQTLVVSSIKLLL